MKSRSDYNIKGAIDRRISLIVTFHLQAHFTSSRKMGLKPIPAGIYILQQKTVYYKVPDTVWTFPKAPANPWEIDIPIDADQKIDFTIAPDHVISAKKIFEDAHAALFDMDKECAANIF
jgi:hypothetical protein